MSEQPDPDTVASARRRSGALPESTAMRREGAAGEDATDTVARPDLTESDVTAIGSRRTRQGAAESRAAARSPSPPTARAAYAPDADALRERTPIRPPQPVFVPRRSASSPTGERPIHENLVDAAPHRAARLDARRRLLGLVLACAAAAAAAAAVLVLLLV